jgi:dinuclear metal center YbgI/SA1388 family protein
MKSIDIESYFNQLLEIEKFNDYGINGIQVDTLQDIKKIALGVTASLEFIEAAIEWGAQIIFVHHGIFWGATPLKGFVYKRVKQLIDSNTGLIAYHLPLDAHEELSHSRGIAKLIGMENVEPFAFDHGGFMGVMGDVSHSINNTLAEITKGSGEIHKIFPFGPEITGRTAIVSGNGTSFLSKAISMGCKTFITGEYDGPSQYMAKEEEITFIAMGHENSELFGLEEVAIHIQENFDVETKVFKFDYMA